MCDLLVGVVDERGPWKVGAASREGGFIQRIVWVEEGGSVFVQKGLELLKWVRMCCLWAMYEVMVSTGLQEAFKKEMWQVVVVFVKTLGRVCRSGRSLFHGLGCRSSSKCLL